MSQLTEPTEKLASQTLGQPTQYASEYDPTLLLALPRSQKRQEIGIGSTLPFYGEDIWNAFELSWLNTNGKPIVAIAQIHFPCDSPSLIESKSFKLYLNSFNNSKFESIESVTQTLEKDLSHAANTKATVKLKSTDLATKEKIQTFKGICLDELDITTDCYKTNPDFLNTKNEIVSETLYSHLLKSNCLVTLQPDWGSIQIQYTGPQINHKDLLKYIISYRNHLGMHEDCVEQIFMDIMTYCKPSKLTVYARYTRRGGLDINPVRSTEKSITVNNSRMARQ